MTHDGGISKDDDMVMSYNVEFDMIKLAKDAMKQAGFKKKDLNNQELIKDVVKMIMDDEKIFEENPEGKKIIEEKKQR